jgi:hypothetical protein
MQLQLDFLAAQSATPANINGKQTHIRTLKIEEDGDFWKGKVRPKIRLKGCWLEQAGFKPGTHVEVKCVASGILELRSHPSSFANAT